MNKFKPGDFVRSRYKRRGEFPVGFVVKSLYPDTDYAESLVRWTDDSSSFMHPDSLELMQLTPAVPGDTLADFERRTQLAADRGIRADLIAAGPPRE